MALCLHCILLWRLVSCGDGRKSQLDHQLPQEFEGIPLFIEGVVLNLPSVAGEAYRFEFAVKAACLLGESHAK